MNEVMTWEEIEAAFDGEWVLIEDPELSSELEVIGGRVIYHCAERDELYRKMGELQPKRSAIIYTGSVPDDLVVML